MRQTASIRPHALIAALGFALLVLPGMAAAQNKDAAKCLKLIDKAQQKALAAVLKDGAADTTSITSLVTNAKCSSFDPTSIGYTGCPSIPGTDCDLASSNTDLTSYLQCVACSVPQRLLPDPCGDGVVDPDIGEQCDPPGSIGGCPNCQVCKADCTCDTLPAGATCPPNSAGGPNFAAVTVVPGADLDSGWTGVGHNQGVVIGAQSFVCLDHCDLTTDPECDGTGPTGNNSINGTTFGPPLPLVAADVATCVINNFDGDIVVRSLNLQTGETEFAVNVRSQVFATGNKQRPCPTCSGKGLGESGKCVGFGPDVGKSCIVEGLTDFGNTSSSCLPFAADDAGTLSITLDPVTSGEAKLDATINCPGGKCPCPGGGSSTPVKVNQCVAGSPCLHPTQCSGTGFFCSTDSDCPASQTCDPNPAAKCPSDDVASGVNSGIDQACCQTGTTGNGKPIIDGCFGVQGRGNPDDDFDIVRRGRAAIPQPAWPDTTYPKIAKGGAVASAFCIPPTNKSTINIPVGLGGPGTVILPGDACVDFLGP